MKKRLTLASAAIRSRADPGCRPARKLAVRKFKAHLIREDGQTKPINAKAIFVDMGGGRDLIIHLYERVKGEGIGVMCLAVDDGQGGHSRGGRVEIRLGAANLLFVSVKK